MLIFFFFLLVCLFSILLYTVKVGISPVPSSFKAQKVIGQLLPENPSGKIYELGAGWGTLLSLLAKKYPDCEIVGYELSPAPFVTSWLRCLGSRNAKVVWDDFFDADLKDAGLVVCYLYPGAMRKLKPKFERELPKGAIVISNTFAVPDWKAEQVIVLDDLYKTKVYLYRLPY